MKLRISEKTKQILKSIVNEKFYENLFHRGKPVVLPTVAELKALMNEDYPKDENAK